MKKQSPKSIDGKGQWSRLVNGLHYLGWVNDLAVESLMSYDDVLVTWTRANVDVLVWLLT